ncbi:MAG: hypothetical protein WAQ12_07975, partial [Tissierellaceae bacterium]
MNKFKTVSFKIVRLVFGLFLFGLGTVCILNAAIGVAPWDVFHQGISNVTGITVGRANIYSGAIIIIIDILLGQAIGWGSIANMYLIGTFIDLLMFYEVVPTFDSFIANLILLFIGMIINGLSVYFYVGVGWGAGPRDGLLVVLTKRTGKSVRLIKSAIEVSAVAIGFALGGNLGIGTLIMAFGNGPVWQYIFKLLKFDLSGVEHRFIHDDIKLLKEWYHNRNKV